MKDRMDYGSPGLAALFRVGLLFLPAIPAYLWLWPRVSGAAAQVTQTLAYVYILSGTYLIGRRSWNADHLGLNRQGIGASLFWGGLLILGRSLVILGVDWGLPAPPLQAARLLSELLFYFVLVGLGEEYLFRGLLYRAFFDWKGLKWAIWGTSLVFMLWHVFGQGLLVGLATFFYGLIFALLRWRAGGIIGLVLVHGAMDWSAAQLLPSIDLLSLGRPEIPHPGWLLLGLALIILVPLCLWKLPTRWPNEST